MRKFLTFITLVFCLSAFSQNEGKTEISILQKVENWYSENMNLWSVTSLMAVESSFIPFPSEVVLPPAAYVAANEKSALHFSDSYPLNLLIIIVFGTIGALIGATINYLLALWLGRPIVYKFAESRLGKLCLLSKEKIVRAEEYFLKYGKSSTFFGRLVPGIRQLISIPAGLVKMHFLTFLGFTAIGATIWNVVLVLLGYFAYGNAELINRYSHEISKFIIVSIIIFALFFIIKKLLKKKTL